MVEQTPKIIMQCPKCRKEFPLDASHCESCSVMLEPVELAQATPEPQGEKAGTVAPESPSDSTEKIEDSKIDLLKTEIENKFVLTLILEIKHLKKKLSRKAHSHTSLKQAASSAGEPGLSARVTEAETEIMNITKRIVNIESILENLGKKIEADIDNLRTKIAEMKQPGLLSYFDGRSRYYRMLSAEMKTKHALLGIIKGRTSPSFFRLRTMSMGLLVISAAALIILAGAIFMYMPRGGVAPEHKTAAGSSEKMSERSILHLLDDIKTANLKKDLPLWESRYAKSYLELKGKKEGLLDQWRNFDYRSLRYRLENLHYQQDSGNATITWEIELLSRETGKITVLIQQLDADFILEDGRLKIRSVKKAER